MGETDRTQSVPPLVDPRIRGSAERYVPVLYMARTRRFGNHQTSPHPFTGSVGYVHIPVSVVGVNRHTTYQYSVPVPVIRIVYVAYMCAT